MLSPKMYDRLLKRAQLLADPHELDVRDDTTSDTECIRIKVGYFTNGCSETFCTIVVPLKGDPIVSWAGQEALEHDAHRFRDMRHALNVAEFICDSLVAYVA